MAEIEKNFSGIWKLNEWSVEKPDGKKTYPFSGNVSGYLMYHPNGWMSANLMQNDRINISDDRLKISKISHLLKNNTEISFEGDVLETIKNFIIDEKKVLASIEERKKQPTTENRFQRRLRKMKEMMDEADKKQKLKRNK